MKRIMVKRLDDKVDYIELEMPADQVRFGYQGSTCIRWAVLQPEVYFNHDPASPQHGEWLVAQEVREAS